MTRASSLLWALLLVPLTGGLAACGNKGPLFLPPPAVQQPEPAGQSSAAQPAGDQPAPAESDPGPAAGD
jgi:predicted small lipoprotein YifL